METIIKKESENYIGNILTFFPFFKLLFIRKPVSCSFLRYFLKPISLILFDLQIRKLFKKKILEKSEVEKKKFHIRTNIKQRILTGLYKVRLVFPIIRPNFSKFFFLNEHKSKFEKKLFQFCKKENVIFLPKKKFIQNLPSIQKLIILKKLRTISHFFSSRDIIQYSSFSTFLFTSFFIKICIFLKLLKRHFSYLSFKTSYNRNFYYELFETSDYVLNGGIDLSFETRYENIFKVYQSFGNLNIQLAHSHETYKKDFNLFLLTELGFFFSPRISDKMFFRIPKLYFTPNNSLKKVKNKNQISAKEENKHFRIIIESNFRMYAYKKKRTEIDIFQQFSEIFYQLPNLVVGDLTVKSINRALKNGISGENIISFLRVNLHEVCEKIPSNVIEQIRIWDFEKKNKFISKIVLASNHKKLWLKKFKEEWNEKIIAYEKGNSKIITIGLY